MSTSPYLSDDSAAITAAALDTAQPSPSTSNMPMRSASDILSGNTDTAQPFPDTTGMATNSRTAPPASPVQVTKPKTSILADILHAVGEVLGGPSTVQRVNPTTGAIEDKPLSRAGRIANTAGIYLRGAAAGAAQHGPAAAGKAALAGATEQQQFQQQQQENTLAQSRNVRETNAAEQQKQMTAANLALMSQQSARLGIDVKPYNWNTTRTNSL